jgi:hypothetical protein
MPATAVYFFCEPGGPSPVLEWLKELERRNPRALFACMARVRLLAALGHELRRPHADLLRDGIYELRARVGRANYRILYFFHGKDVAVLAHGLTKEQEVPTADIQRAIDRRKRYEKDPQKHRATLDI